MDAKILIRRNYKTLINILLSCLLEWNLIALQQGQLLLMPIWSSGIEFANLYWFTIWRQDDAIISNKNSINYESNLRQV